MKILRSNILNYLKKIFDDEISMIQKYIHQDLCSNLLSDLEKACILPFLKIFYDDFIRKITEENISDARFIYDILSTRDNTVKELNNIFEEYLKIYLHDRINALSSSNYFDSIIFMSELFDIFTKLDHLINFVFSSNPLFENSKNLAIIYAINNCHDDYKNRGLQNIMAKYLHDALTQNRDFISIMHSQNHFSAFLRVLDWLENLTTFTLCHLDYLIMRQAQNISTLSIEKIIIKLFDSKINEKLTIEINGRFVQLEQSSKPNNLFFSSHKNSNNLKFNFLVLNSNLWNLTHYCDVSQSQEIGVFNKEFSSWYSRKFHGQHVQYLDQYSRVELKISFTHATYSLNVSGFQASVLNSFTRAFSYTFADLLKITKLSSSTLSLTLLTLVKEKLLSSSPHTNEDNFSSILADTRFKINLNFHQDKNNIEIPNPLDYKAEPTVVEDNNERVINYTMSIQAAIVKIMKTKKNLDKNLLINDIFECLKGLEITPKMVADNINKMTQREFIKLSPNKSHYCYVE